MAAIAVFVAGLEDTDFNLPTMTGSEDWMAAMMDPGVLVDKILCAVAGPTPGTEVKSLCRCCWEVEVYP